MKNNLKISRQEYLHANTWAQRKDGVPLNLLDNLTAAELKLAEAELIKAANAGDTWPIIGLGHIKSAAALPKLYDLLAATSKNIKITVAHSIYQICADDEMCNIALTETAKLVSWQELIDVLYLLPGFKDERVQKMLNDFRHHNDYLVAYNATRALGLPTENVVEKFRNNKQD